MKPRELVMKLSSDNQRTIYHSLVELKTKYLSARNIHDYLIQAGIISSLLKILRDDEVQTLLDERKKTVDVSLSILGDLCNSDPGRNEVSKLHGLDVIVPYLCECEHESIQNRSCRTLANLSRSPELCELLHKSEVIPSIVTRLEKTENVHHQLTYCRALRLMGRTKLQREKIVSHNAVFQVSKLIGPEECEVRKVAIQTIQELSSEGCSFEFASQVQRSGAIKELVNIVKEGQDDATDKIFTMLCHLTAHSNARAEFGAAGGLEKFINMLEDTVGVNKRFSIINVICLCCKESVNRVKVRTLGGLKILCETVNDMSYQKLHDRIISAFQCFIYDETGLGCLLDYGLVAILTCHLQRVALFKSQTISMQDYLKLESCDNDLEYNQGQFEKFYKLDYLNIEDQHEKDSHVNVFSIDSPTYEAKSDWNMDEYQSGVKCKQSFDQPQSYSPATLSPLSTVSFYSPSLSPSSDFSSPSSPSSLDNSTINSDPKYSLVCSKSYKSDLKDGSPGGFSPEKEEMNNAREDKSSYSSEEDEHSDSKNKGTKVEPIKKILSKVDGKLGVCSKLFSKKRRAEDIELDSPQSKKQKEDKLNITDDELPSKKLNQSAVKKIRNGPSSTEQHILIILSRISQMYDPSKYLLQLETVCCFLDYLCMVDQPEKRMARILCRIIQNPLCFTNILQLHMPFLVYQKLLKNNDMAYETDILKSFLKSRHNCLKSFERLNGERRDSVESTSSQLSFLEIDDSWSLDSVPTESKEKSHSQSSSSEMPDTSFSFKAGLILLQDLSNLADSPFGRGEIAHWVHKNENSVKDPTILALLYTLWNHDMTNHYFKKFSFCDVASSSLTADDRSLSTYASYAIDGLCFIGHIQFMSSTHISFKDLDGMFRPVIGHHKPHCNPQSTRSKTECSYLLENNEKDVTFVVDGVRTNASRRTLVLNSDIFRAMLEGHYSESKEANVVLSGTTPFAVRYVIHYLHGCDLSCDYVAYFLCCDRTDENLCDLLDTIVLSHRYMLTDLLEFLLAVLSRRMLSPDNACHVFHFAFLYDFTSLAINCIKVIFNSPKSQERFRGFRKCLLGPDSEIFLSFVFDLILDNK